ncbi:MAG: diguanylate cyclase [Pseudomonadota bacterium]
MSALHLLVVLLPASGALAMLFVVAFSFSGPRVPGRRAFGLLAAVTGFWCLAAAAEYITVDFEIRYWFGVTAYLGIALTPVAWLNFACRYTGWGHFLTGSVTGALLVIPVITIALAYTTRQHGLIWSSVEMVLSPLPDLVVEHGWWFHRVHVPYSYFLFAVGLVILTSRFFSDLSAYRGQIFGVILSATLVFVANFGYTQGSVNIYGIDPTPVFASVFTFGLAVSLFKGFLGTAPLSYREVFMASGEGVIMLDMHARIVDVNPVGAALSAFAEPLEHRLEHAFPWLPLNQEGTMVTQDVAQHSAAIYALRQLVLTGAGGAPVGSAIMIREVTAEHHERSALQELARFDGLTKVLNRRAFLEATTERLADRPEEWPITILFIDLDDFKGINDQFGHRMGDKVLTETARRIEQLLRPGDLVGRLGGDEFAVALDRADDTIADALMDRLNRRIAEPHGNAPNGEVVELSSSIGASIWPKDGDSLEALLDAADKRMYLAKERLRSVSTG